MEFNIMRVAVAGGTGLVGRNTVRALEASGHEVVVLTRSHGVDLISGSGLREAIEGVDAVIDVTNSLARDPEETREFFGTVTHQLMAAEQRAGVKHHLVLSISGIDRVEGNPHYAGKRHQEAQALAGPTPVTVLRATQFHEFADNMISWTRQDDALFVPPALIQPVAVSDVADVLAELAAGDPLGRAPDLAGPEPQDLVDMVRRLLTVRGESLRIVPTWDGMFREEMAGKVLLPGPDARIASTTFDAWLTTQRANAGVL